MISTMAGAEIGKKIKNIFLNNTHLSNFQAIRNYKQIS